MKTFVEVGRRVAGALVLTLAAACTHVPRYENWIAGCEPSAADTRAAASDRIYFVTSRLPDCREEVTRLSRVRADRIRYGEVEATATSDDESIRVGPPALVADHAWRERLQHDLDGAAGRLLVYVHGYNVDFREAAARARRIRQRTGFAGPIILFAWPSQDSGPRYGWDEENALWTQTYYQDLLEQLLVRDDVKELVLVAHSMGTRIALRSVADIDQAMPSFRGKIRTIVLASPDVDRQIFTRDYLRHLNTDGRLTTIYTSRRDRALRVSWGVHGLARAGDTGCAFWDIRWGENRTRCLVGERVGIPSGVTVVDTSLVRDSSYGHSDFVRSRVAAADLCHVLAGHQQIPNRNPIPNQANAFILVDRDPSSCPPGQPD